MAAATTAAIFINGDSKPFVQGGSFATRKDSDHLSALIRDHDLGLSIMTQR
jgi:hypothetical protein